MSEQAIFCLICCWITTKYGPDEHIIDFSESSHDLLTAYIVIPGVLQQGQQSSGCLASPGKESETRRSAPWTWSLKVF